MLRSELIQPHPQFSNGTRDSSEQVRCVVARHRSLGDSKHGVVEPLVVAIKDVAVQTEKDQSREKRRPFVTVDEGVIARNVKEVSRGHIEHIANEELATERSLRRMGGRLEQARSRNPVAPPSASSASSCSCRTSSTLR